MKNFICPLQKIILSSFILFTVFAGQKGCQCRNENKFHSSLPDIRSGNSNGNQSDSSHRESKTNHKKISKINPQEGSNLKRANSTKQMIDSNELNESSSYLTEVKTSLIQENDKNSTSLASEITIPN